MDTFIAYFFTHIDSSLLLVALLLTAVSLAIRWNSTTATQKTNIAFMYLLLFAVGINFLWQAFFYILMPQTAAFPQRYLPSPFEWQVSAAYFGIAVTAIIGAFSNNAIRTASIVLACTTLWGAAIAQLYLSTVNPYHISPVFDVATLAQIIIPSLLIICRCWNGHFSMRNASVIPNQS